MAAREHKGAAVPHPTLDLKGCIASAQASGHCSMACYSPLLTPPKRARLVPPSLQPNPHTTQHCPPPLLRTWPCFPTALAPAAAQVIPSPAFERLRQRYGSQYTTFMESKLTAVEGELGLRELGISPEARAQLQQEVRGLAACGEQGGCSAAGKALGLQAVL